MCDIRIGNVATLVLIAEYGDVSRFKKAKNWQCVSWSGAEAPLFMQLPTQEELGASPKLDRE